MTNPGQGPMGPEAEVSDEPARLRATEIELARMQGEIGSGIRERVAKLEQNQEHFATRADIARLETGQENLATEADIERAKNWGLKSMIAALAAIAILIVRFVSWIWPS